MRAQRFFNSVEYYTFPSLLHHRRTLYVSINEITLILSILCMHDARWFTLLVAWQIKTAGCFRIAAMLWSYKSMTVCCGENKWTFLAESFVDYYRYSRSTVKNERSKHIILYCIDIRPSNDNRFVKPRATFSIHINARSHLKSAIKWVENLWVNCWPLKWKKVFYSTVDH